MKRLSAVRSEGFDSEPAKRLRGPCQLFVKSCGQLPEKYPVGNPEFSPCLCVFPRNHTDSPKGSTWNEFAILWIAMGCTAAIVHFRYSAGKSCSEAKRATRASA